MNIVKLLGHPTLVRPLKKAEKIAKVLCKVVKQGSNGVNKKTRLAVYSRKASELF